MKILKTTKKTAESLTARVYRDLRQAILTGKISGGTRLVESTLAAEMKVSRTPIREALHQLASEGLLYSIPRVGYMVEEMSERDVVDLYTTRIAIEQIATEWAINNITPNELESMRMNLQMTNEAISNGLVEKLTELDKEFHGIIYKACRNKTLYQICRTISDHSLRFRMALIQFPGMAEKTKTGHHKIYEAILAKDPVKAAAEIETHLQKAQDDIVDLLERMRHESIWNQEDAESPF